MPRAYEGDEEAKTWRSLEWIGVPTPYQRRGIGRSLMAEAMRVQATFGVSHLLAWIEPDNTPAQHLFRILGFESMGETWEWERPL